MHKEDEPQESQAHRNVASAGARDSMLLDRRYSFGNDRKNNIGYLVKEKSFLASAGSDALSSLMQILIISGYIEREFVYEAKDDNDNDDDDDNDEQRQYVEDNNGDCRDPPQQQQQQEKTTVKRKKSFKKKRKETSRARTVPATPTKTKKKDTNSFLCTIAKMFTSQSLSKKTNPATFAQKTTTASGQANVDKRRKALGGAVTKRKKNVSTSSETKVKEYFLVFVQDLHRYQDNTLERQILNHMICKFMFTVCKKKLYDVEPMLIIDLRSENSVNKENDRNVSEKNHDEFKHRRILIPALRFWGDRFCIKSLVKPGFCAFYLSNPGLVAKDLYSSEHLRYLVQYFKNNNSNHHPVQVLEDSCSCMMKVNVKTLHRGTDKRLLSVCANHSAKAINIASQFV